MIDEEYADIIHETFPEIKIKDCHFLGEGNFATTFLLNGDIVFKISDADEAAIKEAKREVFVLKHINQKLSFNIPKIVYEGRMYQGRWVFGETLLPGVTYSYDIHDDLSRKKQSDILRQIGSIMRELHGLKVMDKNNFYSVSDYQENLDLFNKNLTEHVRDYVGPDGVEQLREIYQRYKFLSTNYPVKPVFVHGDLHYGNLMFDKKSKKITGVIDFGSSHLAEPSRDMLYYYGDGVNDLLQGYGKTNDAYLSERQKFQFVLRYIESINAEMRLRAK